jgi:hypothetical protein
VTRRTSTFEELADLARDAMASALATAATEVLVCFQGVDPQKREALYQNARAAFSRRVRQRWGGDELRMYVPRVDVAERQARDDRIAAGLAAGEDLDKLARREGTTARHARRIRGRIGG